MATADVVSVKNEKVASVELNPSIFEAKVRPHLYHAEVRRQLAGRRQGTHSTKNRAAVSGGGAKPYRQKGTGRARQGTTRAPQFAGGGVVFGPVPRTYEHKLTKKMRRAALARRCLRLRSNPVNRGMQSLRFVIVWARWAIFDAQFHQAMTLQFKRQCKSFSKTTGSWPMALPALAL